jgi:hypothetical protein
MSQFSLGLRATALVQIVVDKELRKPRNTNCRVDVNVTRERMSVQKMCEYPARIRQFPRKSYGGLSPSCLRQETNWNLEVPPDHLLLDTLPLILDHS